MAKEDAFHWDERYRSGRGPVHAGADSRLEPYAAAVDGLAAQARAAGRAPRALDVACGAGGTLLWLARRGWLAAGVDVSAAALELARAAAQAAGVAEAVSLLCADLDGWRPAARSAELVTCFYFLDRGLLPQLAAAVRPGGLLIVETFNRHRLRMRPETRPAHLLWPGEPLEWAAAWGWQVEMHRSGGPDDERPADAAVLRRPPAVAGGYDA